MTEVKRLVFYRRIADVPDGAACISGATGIKEKTDLVMSFAHGRVNPLYVHHLAVTGWQLPAMYEDEYSVEFVGEGWSKAELAQGTGRIRPRSKQ